MSDQNLIHLQPSEKYLVKLQRRFPELNTIDIGYIIEKAKTETKIINYMLDKILTDGAEKSSYQNPHVLIMP